MLKKIQSALISVFYKDGLDKVAHALHQKGIKIYTTGGTQQYIEQLGIPCIAVESLTSYPSILGGRVKTLHPAVFGGILGRRNNETDIAEMTQYQIPEMDLVIVDLYPFEETVANTTEEKAIIEKIDIGGPSMIRAAAKNHQDVAVVASKEDYTFLVELLETQEGATTLEQRRMLAMKAFDVCTGYDLAISNYFRGTAHINPFSTKGKTLRYGENPHQKASFSGDLDAIFEQLNGKELSYNNLVDVDAAVQLIQEFNPADGVSFSIIKHTNVCGIATRSTSLAAWNTALAGDPESAFGGVLATNAPVDKETAEAIHELFFEVLIAPHFSEEALEILKGKKNRILLRQKEKISFTQQSKTLLNGLLTQGGDEGNYQEWEEVGARSSNAEEKADLIFANIVCKHLKSNAIALVKNQQLIGKGCGQTSRIDALRHAVEKARQFNFDLSGAVLASDAFFPFSDCVELAAKEGIQAFIQPGGSIRDKDSIEFCKNNGLVMVITGLRHFKH